MDIFCNQNEYAYMYKGHLTGAISFCFEDDDNDLGVIYICFVVRFKRIEMMDVLLLDFIIMGKKIYSMQVWL